MSHATERWTADEVRALPDDGQRYELIDGELVVTPRPPMPHQVALAELYRRLDPHVRATGIGEILWSPADLSLGEDEILQPDLFVYPTPAGPRLEWSDITSLLLVVEVLSPSTARYDRQLKRRRYQRAGVPEYWIVDLDARLVDRWRPEDDRPEVLSARIEWQPDVAGPALEIDLAAFFTAVLGEP